MGVYSTGYQFAASSCGWNAIDQPTFAFGFQARSIHLSYSCGPSLYYNLLGQTATTSMGYMTCGQQQIFTNLTAGGIGLMTTATSTTALGQPIVGITAWTP